MKKVLGDWGTYSEDHCCKYGERWLFTTKFTDENGVFIYKFFISVRGNQGDTLYLYRHKNPRARLFERKYFQSRDEIIEYLNSKDCIDRDKKK